MIVHAPIPNLICLAVLAPGPSAGLGPGDGGIQAAVLAPGPSGNPGAVPPTDPGKQATGLRWKADSGHVWIYNNTKTSWLVAVQKGEGKASRMRFLQVRLLGGDPVRNRARGSVVNHWHGSNLKLESGWSLVLEKTSTSKWARKRSWKDFECTLRPEHATGQESQVLVQAKRVGAGTGAGPDDDLFYDFQWSAASGITRVVQPSSDLVICLGGEGPAVAAPHPGT